jgi:hypothetical protein
MVPIYVVAKPQKAVPDDVSGHFRPAADDAVNKGNKGRFHGTIILLLQLQHRGRAERSASVARLRAALENFLLASLTHDFVTLDLAKSNQH